jgi:hypothetical protein
MGFKMIRVFLAVSAFSTFSQSIIDSIPESIVMSCVPASDASIVIDGNKWYVYGGVTWIEAEGDGRYHPRVIIK